MEPFKIRLNPGNTVFIESSDSKNMNSVEFIVEQQKSYLKYVELFIDRDLP